jgi:hypothetical protein
MLADFDGPACLNCARPAELLGTEYADALRREAGRDKRRELAGVPRRGLERQRHGHQARWPAQDDGAHRLPGLRRRPVPTRDVDGTAHPGREIPPQLPELPLTPSDRERLPPSEAPVS